MEKSWWFLVSECSLCLETVFVAARNKEMLSFHAKLPNCFDVGYVLSFRIQTFLRQLGLQLVQDIPHLYKIPFQENNNQKKTPAKTRWLDAFPQPCAEKEKTRSGSWGSWRCIDLSETKLLGVYFFFGVTVGYMSAGIKWHPSFLGGHQP